MHSKPASTKTEQKPATSVTQNQTNITNQNQSNVVSQKQLTGAVVKVAQEGPGNQSTAIPGTSQELTTAKFVEVSQAPTALSQGVPASRIINSPPVATVQQGGKMATFTEIKSQPLLLVSMSAKYSTIQSMHHILCILIEKSICMLCH